MILNKRKINPFKDFEKLTKKIYDFSTKSSHFVLFFGELFHDKENMLKKVIQNIYGFCTFVPQTYFEIYIGV